MRVVGRLARFVNTVIEQAKTLFVVEYSISQDATRVHSVGPMLKNNVRDIVANSITDYVPVALLATRSAAEMLAVKFRYHVEDQVLADRGGWTHVSDAIKSFFRTLDSEVGKSKK